MTLEELNRAERLEAVLKLVTRLGTTDLELVKLVIRAREEELLVTALELAEEPINFPHDG